MGLSSYMANFPGWTQATKQPAKTLLQSPPLAPGVCPYGHAVHESQGNGGDCISLLIPWVVMVGTRCRSYLAALAAVTVGTLGPLLQCAVVSVAAWVGALLCGEEKKTPPWSVIPSHPIAAPNPSSTHHSIALHLGRLRHKEVRKN